MADNPKMLERFKNVGSRFAFELAVEVFHNDIIVGLRKFLAGYTPEDIPRMVETNEFPYVEPGGFDVVKGLEKYMEKINTDRLAEAIAEARPDLAEAIIAQGVPGGVYLHKLREYFLEIIKNPEKAFEQKGSITPGRKKNMKLLTCDACHQSWPVPEDEVASVKECPFCHTGRDEPAPAGS